MSDPGPDRLVELERRVAELERLLGTGAAPEPTRALERAAAVTSATRIAPVTPAANAEGARAAAAPAAPLRAAAAPSRIATPSRSFADLEEQLSSRLLAWVGGVALLIGAVFFLSLAFSRGWIGPEARVLIGLVAGAAALGVGAWLFDRGSRTPATVLTGVGVGTGALALFAAGRLFELIPIEAALVGFLVIAVLTAAIALRAGSQAVAAFGIVATTLAPPVLGASPTLATVLFLGIAIVGIALISLGRSWPWLALLAFLATAPQAARWFLDEGSIVLAIAGVIAFWAIHAVAASGGAVRGITHRIHPGTAALLVLNAVFAIGAIRWTLPEPLFRTILLAGLAGAHGALGVSLLLRRRRRDPFGVLTAGLGIGVLAIAIAIELGGVARPIAFTGLAVAVAWVAVRFRDRAAAGWAAIVGAFAVADLVIVQYPFGRIGWTVPEGWPFGSPEGIVAVVMSAALIVTALIARQSFLAAPPRRWYLTPETALAVGGVGACWILGYASVFELWPDQLVIGWSVLGAATFGLAGFVHRDPGAWLVSMAGGASLIGAAALSALSELAPIRRLVVEPGRPGPTAPLLNAESLALAAVALALVIGGRIVARRSPPPPAIDAATPGRLAAAAFAAAGFLSVHLISIAIVDAFQVRLGPGVDSDEIATQAQVALSIAWVVIGAGAFATGLVRRISVARLFGLGLLSVATAKVFLFDLAALDVAYRVLSFIGLGGVLLASSFVASRFRTTGAAVNAAREPDGDPVVTSEPGSA